jgi:hypothetical protein
VKKIIPLVDISYEMPNFVIKGKQFICAGSTIGYR